MATERPNPEQRVCLWRKDFEFATRWMATKFPHYTSDIVAGISFDEFRDETRVVIGDVRTRQGEPIDAQYTDSNSTIAVNADLTATLAEPERRALIVHEATEGFGISARIFHGWGFNIVIPEHEYAEFVEGEFRREHAIADCKFKLEPEALERMKKLDEFFRLFPEKLYNIGSTIDYILRKEPGSEIDADLRDRVLARHVDLYGEGSE